MLLDVGANMDSNAENLVQFAAMGAILAEHVLKVPNPRIGLLNIGEETEKGDDLAREAHANLAALELRFVGNVEAQDMIAHHADVVVCDGFVGNVVIKFFEGLTSYIFRSLREDLQQGIVAPVALLALKPGFDRLRARFDYERFGGAPLLGVRGVSIVTHGRARARMIENALRVASEAAHADVPGLIVEWTREHPALAHQGVRDRLAARLRRERRRPMSPGNRTARRTADPGLLGRRLALFALFEAEFRPGTASAALERLAAERGGLGRGARPRRADRERSGRASGRARCAGSPSRRRRSRSPSSGEWSERSSGARIYEVLYSAATPSGETMRDAVSLARIYAGDAARRLVNGVLGSVSRSGGGA